MSKRDEILLYTVPPSFYSQIARLVLAEKKVPHRQVVVAPGPPTYETYRPWYMRLNPMGTVPTLVVAGEAIDDSRKILRFVDREFTGPALFPADEAVGADVEQWVEEAYGIPERVIAYGMDEARKLGARINRKRLAALQKWRGKAPEMQDVYDRKIADIVSFLEETHDPEKVEEAWEETRRRLDWAEGRLAGRTFCCGETYTAADVVWTVTVARQLMLGSNPFEGRPELKAWFSRMEARPSYAEADVWARFKPEVMIPVLLAKFKWPLSAGVTLVALVSYAAAAWLGG